MKNGNLNNVGELYLRKGPKFEGPAHNFGFTPLHLEENMKNATFRKNFDFMSRLPVLAGHIESKDAVRPCQGKLAYRYTDSFWQLSMDDNQNLVLTESDALTFRKMTYNSIKDLEEEFVKLSQFLSEASFVGRKFRRTSPCYNRIPRGDRSFMWASHNGENSNIDTQYVVLYAMQDLFLVKCFRSYDNGEYPSYVLIDRLFLRDLNFEIYGPILEEYRDKKNIIYDEILQQVNQTIKRGERIQDFYNTNIKGTSLFR